MDKPIPNTHTLNAKMHSKWKEEEIKNSVEDFAVKTANIQHTTMAAGVAAAVMDIRKEMIRSAVQPFHSLEHRMEYVGTIKGVEFINDSKATNVNGTWFSLESMKQPTILILGGVDNGNNYLSLKPLVKQKVKAIVCMGIDNIKINEAFKNEIELLVNTSNIRDAVQAAFHFADKGDAVLLSPACASFDLFRNYEDRGIQFKQAVKEL